MIDIIVIRCGGTHPGDDIVDPLITSVDVALQRGRFEINEHSGMRPVTLVTKYRNDVELGQMAEVHDALQGKTWRGKISGIAHEAQGPKLVTKLELLRPRDASVTCI